MCWPFVVERCITTAPIYFTALMFGTGLLLLLNPSGSMRSDSAQLAEFMFGVGMFFFAGIISAAAYVNKLPEPFGELITTLATGVGYFAHLVIGPLAFAGVAITIGAVTTVVTHSLIGEYV